MAMDPPPPTLGLLPSLSLLHFTLLPLLLQFPLSVAGITVYYAPGQTPLTASPTGGAAAANYTGAAAYNPTTLEVPAPPGPAMPTSFALALSSTTPPGASIMQNGYFFGFSIEMSVVNQVLGKNASFLEVPFLNLMSNIQQRAGAVIVRVGGNTQETATLVASTSDGRILEKDLRGITNPTQTPPLIFTPELLYMLSNISSLVNVHWHLGIPFNDTQNFRLGIAEAGQRILGGYLMGMQVGNEPDLYVAHGHRPQGYGPYDYFGEFGDLVQALANDNDVPNKSLLIGPNVNSGDWSPEMVWNTRFVDAYAGSLAFLAVEHYPTDNCFAQYGIGIPRDPQATFPTFLNHTAPLTLIAPYLNSTSYAQSKNKKLLMFETNSASCGGFPGISDAFGAALWGVDYAMGMGAGNFSGAFFHVGGMSVYYNPFTPPPTNQSMFRQWTIGPIYYAALVVAEALGPTNTSQVIDLQANGGNMFSPAYAVYEGGKLVRVLVVNYASDESGESDVEVQLGVDGGMPGMVQVKYLLASSVSQKGNFTWAGQTFGGNFDSDGRPMGAESIETVICAPDPSLTSSPNANANVCMIRVPAPGVALVFIAGGSAAGASTAGTVANGSGGGGGVKTFATTVKTRTRGTVTVDPAVLRTSNGHWGMDRDRGSTSEGSFSAAVGSRLRRGWGIGIGIVLSGVVSGVVGLML